MIDKRYHTCPAPSQGGQCGDCRQCWDPKVKVVSYGKLNYFTITNQTKPATWARRTGELNTKTGIKIRITKKQYDLASS